MDVAGAAWTGEHHKKTRCKTSHDCKKRIFYSGGARTGMLIGYARGSKADGSQLLDLQRDALIDAGVAAERIYEHHASERKDRRPGLDAGLKALHPGNALVVWKLDRLGRDLKNLTDLRGEGISASAVAGR